MKAIIGKSAKSATPISSHPLFPAIVALWFAALFGFGSLVLPTILIERAVVAIGLPSLIGAAAPPLGFTAKFGIALMAALFGAALGFFIARKVAISQKPDKARQRGFGRSNEVKKPLSAAEELGSETLDTPVEEAPNETSGRRRGLAMNEEENAPSEFLQQASLPSSNPLGDDHAVAPSQHSTPAMADSANPLSEEETISFMQQDQQNEQNSMNTAPIHLNQAPAQAAAPAEQQFETKQVFQPQAASPIEPVQAQTEAVPPVSQDQNYQDDVQRGMPRLKVEPDPEPEDLNDQFGFQPLQDGTETQTAPVDPQLEARLSGLVHEDENELPPTSGLEDTLRAASQQPTVATTATGSTEPPLAFSPPSLGKQAGEKEPDEAEPLDLAEIAVADDVTETRSEIDQAEEKEEFSLPPGRPFAMPKGFEDAKPLGAEPAMINEFDPIAELSQQSQPAENSEPTEPVSPFQELHSELEQSIQTGTGDSTSAQEEAAAETDELDEIGEDLPIVTDPISGKPLDALGTVELIERLAKSVRLRASGTAAPAAIAASMAEKTVEPTSPEVAADEVQPEASARTPDQPENESEPVPAYEPTPVQQASTPAAPIQEFGKPLDLSQQASTGSLADDNFVPSALKPIELDQEEELDDEEESFSLPLRNPAPSLEAQPVGEAAASAKEQPAFPPIPQSFAPQETDTPAVQSGFDSASDEDEQPFGSLLELRNRLTQPQEFVRVDDEPVDDNSAEPAVVFPGQNGQPTPLATQEAAPTPEPAPPASQDFSKPQVAAPVPQPQTQASPAPQKFGAQDEIQQQSFAPQGFTHRPQASDAAPIPSEPAGQPSAQASKDPAETERALRSALATLQRMSGAA